MFSEPGKQVQVLSKIVANVRFHDLENAALPLSPLRVVLGESHHGTDAGLAEYSEVDLDFQGAKMEIFAQQWCQLPAAAEAFAAEAVGDTNSALAKLKEAVAIEDSIDDLSQPPYPVIPATELAGNLLLDVNRPAEAAPYFQKILQRTKSPESHFRACAHRPSHR